MEKLIKPVEYAHQMGISRQAVYAKIKRGILQSKSVDGKLYIVVDEESHSGKNAREENSSDKHTYGVPAVAKKGSHNSLDYETLLQAKDETIDVLKGTVKDLKESNRQMSTTLRGEIDLLKEAFHEMRTLYVTQIEHIRKPENDSPPKVIDVSATEQDSEGWISLKKFFRKQDINKAKKQEKLIKKFKKAFKKGDSRIISEDGEIKLKKRETFKDITG